MNELNPGWFSLAWQIGCAIVGLVGGVVGLWATRHFAKREDLAKANDNAVKVQIAQNERLTRIEEQLKQAPKHRDLVELSHAVGELAGRVARMEGQTEQTNNLLAAIHDHLLNEK